VRAPDGSGITDAAGDIPTARRPDSSDLDDACEVPVAIPKSVDVRIVVIALRNELNVRIPATLTIVLATLTVVLARPAPIPDYSPDTKREAS